MFTQNHLSSVWTLLNNSQESNFLSQDVLFFKILFNFETWLNESLREGLEILTFIRETQKS